MLALKPRMHRQKGRPRLVREAIDCGTPEVQSRRQIVINTLGLDSSVCLTEGHNAAIDGCYLHQLFYQGGLNQQQLETGLRLRKLHDQCLRSQGIKNRLSCSSKRWDGLKGTNVDDFEKPEIERKWQTVKKIIEEMEGDRFTNQLIIKIILNDSLSMDVYGKVLADYNFLKCLQRSLDVLSCLILGNRTI